MSKKDKKGKKGKKGYSLTEDFQAVIAMIPRLEAMVKIHEEIAKGYHKYRKNGGERIPGIEKHLAYAEQSCEDCKKTEKIAPNTKAELSKETDEIKKTKKKAN